MTLKAYFASSSKVWASIEWVFGIEDAGYDGWEISADGNYRLDNPGSLSMIKDVLESTSLEVSVHAPYADLNLASLNYPIYRESIRQLSVCIEKAAELTDRVTIHPGYMSPAGKLVPEQVWTLQKDALVEIGKVAENTGVRVCLENMPDIPDFLCRYYDELSGMVYGVDGIGTTFDLGHANTVGELDLFTKNIQVADHIHIHDNNGHSDEHLPLGGGNMNWDSIGKSVFLNYSGICVIEGRNIKEAGISLNVFKRCFR